MNRRMKNEWKSGWIGECKMGRTNKWTNGWTSDWKTNVKMDEQTHEQQWKVDE